MLVFLLIGSWPFLVSLQLHCKDRNHCVENQFSHGCGGSIINAYQVLTAAHCFKATHGYEKGGKFENNKRQNLVPKNWIVLAGNHIFILF